MACRLWPVAYGYGSGYGIRPLASGLLARGDGVLLFWRMELKRLESV